MLSISSTKRRATNQPRLTQQQQHILAELIDTARLTPGGHVAIGRNRWSYWAKHEKGRTHWSVGDEMRSIVASGVLKRTDRVIAEACS